MTSLDPIYLTSSQEEETEQESIASNETIPYLEVEDTEPGASLGTTHRMNAFPFLESSLSEMTFGIWSTVKNAEREAHTIYKVIVNSLEQSDSEPCGISSLVRIASAAEELLDRLQITARKMGNSLNLEKSRKRKYEKISTKSENKSNPVPLRLKSRKATSEIGSDTQKDSTSIDHYLHQRENATFKLMSTGALRELAKQGEPSIVAMETTTSSQDPTTVSGSTTTTAKKL